MWIVFLLACGNSSPDIGPTTEQGPQNTSDPQVIQPKEGNNTPEDQAPEIPTYKEGETITLSGVTSYRGETNGNIVMEVLQNANNSPYPTLMQQQKLDEIGPFEIKVPKDTANLVLMIYMDTTGDQASDDDPKGYYNFAAGSANIENITVELLNTKDLANSKDKGAEKKEEPVEKKEDTKK